MSDGMKFKGAPIETSADYVVNKDVKLPSWVKCKVCGGKPTGADWLKPVSPDPNCREFVHLSHIPNGPDLSREAGHILRNLNS